MKNLSFLSISVFLCGCATVGNRDFALGVDAVHAGQKVPAAIYAVPYDRWRTQKLSTADNALPVAIADFKRVEGPSPAIINVPAIRLMIVADWQGRRGVVGPVVSGEGVTNVTVQIP